MDDKIGWAVRVEVEVDGVTEEFAVELCERLGIPVGFDARTDRIDTSVSIYGSMGPAQAIDEALAHLGLGGRVIIVEAMTFTEQDRLLALPSWTC